jgi:hypothetical protein
VGAAVLVRTRHFVIVEYLRVLQEVAVPKGPVVGRGVRINDQRPPVDCYLVAVVRPLEVQINLGAGERSLEEQALQRRVHVVAGFVNCLLPKRFVGYYTRKVVGRETIYKTETNHVGQLC